MTKKYKKMKPVFPRILPTIFTLSSERATQHFILLASSRTTPDSLSPHDSPNAPRPARRQSPPKTPNPNLRIDAPEFLDSPERFNSPQLYRVTGRPTIGFRTYTVILQSADKLLD
jgi:hypothetical protein